MPSPHSAGELCDDGNDVETDECDSMCKIVERRKVFVTSTKYSGNLGGLSGANAKCTSVANGAGLTGMYRAWLSNESDSPSDFFDKNFTGLYVLANGTTVAEGWIGLISGSLQNPIDRDEKSNPTVTGVWTNTESDGTPDKDELVCGSWTLNAGITTIGLSTSKTSTWTKSNTNAGCSGMNALYCFEDPT